MKIFKSLVTIVLCIISYNHFAKFTCFVAASVTVQFSECFCVVHPRRTYVTLCSLHRTAETNSGAGVWCGLQTAMALQVMTLPSTKQVASVITPPGRHSLRNNLREAPDPMPHPKERVRDEIGTSTWLCSQPTSCYFTSRIALRQRRKEYLEIRSLWASKNHRRIKITYVSDVSICHNVKHRHIRSEP
jgi:hypothetical protein